MPPKITNLYICSALATIGGLLQGFDVASLSAIQATTQYKSYFGSPDSTTIGGITASMAGGSLLGSLFSSWSGDRFGRRDSVFGACLIFILGSVLMSAAQNRPMLIASRIVNGFAVGIITSQGPVYIAEISPPARRGRLIALQQWMITLGILIMYFISYGTSFIPSAASFRLPWALQIGPAILLLCCLPLMPRSPRWLARKDRWEEAIRNLAMLRAAGNAENETVVAELQEIREKIQQELAYNQTSWLELVNSRNFIRVHCAIFAHIWAQYTGINALMYYIVYIFQMAGRTGSVALFSASIQYVINVVMTVPALIFIDKLPRRTVMMGGSLMMAVWLFATGGIMASRGHAILGGLHGSPTVTWEVTDDTSSKAIIVLSYLFVATYATTWGPIGWIYPAEIIPLYIRSKSVSMATFFNWACNFSLTFFTPPAFQYIQWKIYIIFGTFCAVAFVHVFLFFQETQGRSLEQMNDIFDNNTFAFNTMRSAISRTAVAEDPKRVVHEAEAKGLQLNS